MTTSEHYDDIEIRVKKVNSTETSLIPGLSAKDKVTYLGIISSRDENPQHQLIIALAIAKEGARIPLCNPFNNYQSFIYLNSHFMPKLTYPFTSACFTSNQYDNIESIIIPTTIAKMGFNRTWPLVLRYGFHPFVGLGLRKLETEALINKIQWLQSFMGKSDSLRLILISFQWCQYIYDVSYPILATTKPFVKFDNRKWL